MLCVSDIHGEMVNAPSQNWPSAGYGDKQQQRKEKDRLVQRNALGVPGGARTPWERDGFHRESLSGERGGCLEGEIGGRGRDGRRKLDPGSMDLFEEIVKMRRAGRRGALATIVHTNGSIPSYESSRMLV